MPTNFSVPALPVPSIPSIINTTLASNFLRCSKPQVIIHCNNDLLIGPEIALCRLDRRVPKQEFDLLEIPTALPAQLRASPAEVMGTKVLDPDLLR